MLKTALIQQQCTANKADNLNKTIDMIRKAQVGGARLIVLQELHASLYFCQTVDERHFELAESIDGETVQRLQSLSAELDVVIVASIFERRMAGLYHNTAVVLDCGEIAGIYRKMHIPDDPQFYEKYYFSPGDTGFEPISTSVGRLGVLVCWDQWYPEAARIMALRGADMLIYPTAIGWINADDTDNKPKYKEAWTTIQRSHAIANGIPVLTVNRVGFEAAGNSQTDGIDFWGGSYVCDGYGHYLAQAQTVADEIIYADIDLSESESIRRAWPFFRDRRIDEYYPVLDRCSI